MNDRSFAAVSVHMGHRVSRLKDGDTSLEEVMTKRNKGIKEKSLQKEKKIMWLYPASTQP